MVYAARYDWMPPASQVPGRVQRMVLPFTPGRRGWSIWYRNQTRYICGRSVPLEKIPELWQQKKAAIDADLAQPHRALADHTLRQALSEYFNWLDHRLATGLPRPLAVPTADLYKMALSRFARFVVAERKWADLRLMEFGPEQFKSYAESQSFRAPSSFARIVGIIRGFFHYCRDEGFIPAAPNFGRYFVAPSKSEIRDRRWQQHKAYEPEELWALWEHANVQQRAWMGLALSGAMDNADLSFLTFDLFDNQGMQLDYRRRKTGRVLRLIPLHPLAREWLDAYLTQRPQPADPAYKDLVFLTPTGLPLQRSVKNKQGMGNHIDYVVQSWDRLLRKAGLRAKETCTQVCRVCGQARSSPQALCCGQGGFRNKRTSAAKDGPDYRGFRSLRTTFATLTPRGFSEERKLIMGHSRDITLEHYVEKYGIKHLRRLVEEIWLRAFTAPWPRGSERKEAEPGAVGSSFLA